jgi:hypothetical protein
MGDEGGGLTSGLRRSAPGGGGWCGEDNGRLEAVAVGGRRHGRTARPVPWCTVWAGERKKDKARDTNKWAPRKLIF